LLSGPAPALLTSLCIAITWAYRIDRSRHAEIRRKLAERNQARASEHRG
jgi:Na+/melibiose symporter-like transporter